MKDTIWHEFPKEKPPSGGKYVVCLENGHVLIGYYYVKENVFKTQGVKRDVKLWQFRPEIPINNKRQPDTLCWECYRSVHWVDDPASCSWAKKFKPVDGWNAIEVKRENGDIGYCVLACPLFQKEKQKKKRRVKK